MAYNKPHRNSKIHCIQIPRAIQGMCKKDMGLEDHLLKFSLPTILSFISFPQFVMESVQVISLDFIDHENIYKCLLLHLSSCLFFKKLVTLFEPRILITSDFLMHFLICIFINFSSLKSELQLSFIPRI